ncbi:MAG: HAD family phosphatase [Candidatus Omnitrophica bacterium]|nr:HAD family phosphatase [Candidatus Omnitrophota bacterium]
MKNPPRIPAAVIFDMDGVIVDSMPYHYLAWYEALKPYGIRVTCFDEYAKEGERWDKTLESLFRNVGIRPRRSILGKIFSRRQRIFRRYFKRYLFPGAPEFLACLKDRGYRLALATGTPMHEVNKILPRTVLRVFEAVIAGDHVKRGKPHPEPYVMAARALGLAPRECVVVENAPYGIESAKRAGMFCIAVTTSLPKEYLSRADLIVERLEQIPQLLEAACRIKEKRKK